MSKSHFLTAPETQIGAVTKATIEEWSEPPTALQILKTLDSAVHGADCSTFAVKALEIYLDRAIIAEQTTYAAVALMAAWRNV